VLNPNPQQLPADGDTPPVPQAAPTYLPVPMHRQLPDPEAARVVYVGDVSGLMARRQSEMLMFVAFIVVALVAFSVSPYIAVTTAFAAGSAAIELRRRSDKK